MKKILIVAIVLIASINTKAQKKIKGNVFEQMEDSTKVPISFLEFHQMKHLLLKKLKCLILAANS